MSEFQLQRDFRTTARQASPSSRRATAETAAPVREARQTR